MDVEGTVLRARIWLRLRRVSLFLLHGNPG